MTVSVIDTEFDGTSYYNEAVELDGVDYEFKFYYNSRDEHWHLTLRTEAGEQIIGCEGMKLVQGGFPLKRVTDAKRPEGELFVFGPSEQEPGLFDLGNDTVLAYIPLEDLPE